MSASAAHADACRVEFASTPWEAPAPHVRTKCVQRAGRQLRIVEFSRGFVEADWCLKGHIGYVLQGEFELRLQAGTLRFASGDGIFIPGGPEYAHKAHVLSDTVTVVLVEEL